MVIVKSPKVKKSKNGSIFKMFTSVFSRLLDLLVLGIWVTKSVLPRTGFLSSRWILSYSWVLLRKVSLWNVSNQNKYSKRTPLKKKNKLKAMAPHSSTPAWKIPWMEEPGRLQSMGSLKVRHNWATSLSLFTFMHWRRKWQPTPVFLPGESQGRGSLVGCRLRGHTESDMTEAT